MRTGAEKYLFSPFLAIFKGISRKVRTGAKKYLFSPFLAIFRDILATENSENSYLLLNYKFL